MRFSMLQLLTLVSLFAMAIVSLKFANQAWWTILSSFGLLLFLAMGVAALVEQGERRVFPTGFTFCALVYGLLLFFSGTRELGPLDSRVPTSNILLPIYESMVTRDTASKEPDPAQNRLTFVQFGGVGGPSLVGRPIYFDFMSVGHLWWALLLGWLGGRFAQFIHARQPPNINRKERYA